MAIPALYRIRRVARRDRLASALLPPVAHAFGLDTGRSGAAILVSVMGIILCSLAVEIVLTTLGVASWAPVPR
jgi:small neutral amino acid transporter SnatA (MarC family)